jgi:type VI protein secretion system component Hcp
MASEVGFFQFADIKGNGKEKNHEGWIKFLTMDLHLSSLYHYHQPGSGGYSVSNITLTKLKDVTTPQIQSAVIKKKTGDLTIELTDPSSNSKPSTSYKLTDAQIISYSTSTDAQGITKEVIQIAFSRYEVKFMTYDKNHKPQPPVMFTCDVHQEQ